MKNKTRLGLLAGFFIVLFGVSIGSNLVSACSNLGPGKHMGVVKMIDSVKGAFTLVDAETRRPVRFMIGEDLLKTVKINDTIVVTYHQTEKGQFVAKEIVVHAVGGTFSSGPNSLHF